MQQIKIQVRSAFGLRIVTISGGELPHPISARHADVSTAYRRADQAHRVYAHLRKNAVPESVAYAIAQQQDVRVFAGGAAATPGLADRVTDTDNDEPGFVVEKTDDSTRCRVWYARRPAESQFSWRDTAALSR